MKHSQPLERLLGRDGKRLRSGLDPHGSLASQVMGQLDRTPQHGSRTALSPQSVSTELRGEIGRGQAARIGSLRLVVGLLSAAVLLLVFVPLWMRASEESQEHGDGVRPIAVVAQAMLAPSEIERLHPVRLLRSLGHPLSALMAEESRVVERSLIDVAENLSGLLPSFLPRGPSGG